MEYVQLPLALMELRTKESRLSIAAGLATNVQSALRATTTLTVSLHHANQTNVWQRLVKMES